MNLQVPSYLSPLSLDKNREMSIIIEGKAVDTLVKQFAKDWSMALDLEKGREEALEKRWIGIIYF